MRPNLPGVIAAGLLASTALSGPCSAFSPLWPPPPAAGIVSGGYIGPGDQGYNFLVWWSGSWGLTRAFAQPGTNKMLKLKRQLRGVACCTFIDDCELYLKPDGSPDLDVTLACTGGTETVDTWGQYRYGLIPNAVGTGGTGGGSFTLNITSVSSGQFRPGMAINNTTTYITSYGTGSGGNGTYNLSAFANFSGTITGQPARVTVDTFYDQATHSACSGTPCDAVLQGGTNPLTYSWGSDGLREGDYAGPGISGKTITTRTWKYQTANQITTSSPYGFSGVGAMSGTAPNLLSFLYLAIGTTTCTGVCEPALSAQTVGPAWTCNSSNSATRTSTGLTEALNCDAMDGSVNTLNVGGSESTGSPSVSVSGRTGVIFINDEPGTGNSTFNESGFGTAAMPYAIRGKICANQHDRYGTANSGGNCSP